MRRLLPPHRSLITPRTPGPTATTAALILAPHLTAPLTDPGNRIFHIVPSTGALLSSTLSGLDKTFRLKRASVVATVPVSSWKRLLALMKRVRQEVGRSSELDMAWVRRMCEELERWGEGGGEGERLAVWRCEAGVRSGGSLVNTLYEGSVVGCTNDGYSNVYIWSMRLYLPAGEGNEGSHQPVKDNFPGWWGYEYIIAGVKPAEHYRGAKSRWGSMDSGVGV